MMLDAKNKKTCSWQSFAGYEFSAYMGEKGMDKSLVNKARRILASVLIAALCVCNMAVPAFAEEAVAASFRLYQTEGTVKVQNQNGKEMTAMQDMKLFNGYQISTEQKSYAWFEADSTKLFKMDAVSNLEVRKKGKQSELLLNSGNLFFNVTEHLQDDEVLNIRTSSMVVGIRGTSGWVKVIDQYHTILYMLDGSVEASVTDPVSGQRKSITLRGGQRAEFWIYDKNKEGDKCDIIVRQYGEEEIDGFVAVELKKNQQLQDRIRGGGGSGAGGGGGTGAGFDLVSTIAKAEERLEQDQEEVARKLEEIKKQLAGLAHKVDVDPVFSNNTSKDDSGSDGGVSGGSATETVADPTTLTMPVSDDTVHDYLNNKKVSVILQPSSNASDNVLTVDSGLTVPSGKSLTVGNGISADVQNGQTLQVNGHMEMEGSLTNAGTVNNTSANTLQIGGDLDNAGTLENRTGRLIVKGAFLNRGTLNTGNTVENSSAVQNTGTFTITGGTAGAVDVNRGGTLVVNDGTVSSVAENGGALQLNGGTISSLTVSTTEVDLSKGTVDHVDVNGGTLVMDGGTANEVNMPGNGTIVLNSGNAGNLTIENGTVEAHAGAVLKHVNVQGGTFELNGGVVTNGVTQSNTAEVRLNSGEVKTTDESYSAIQIDAGNMVLNLDEVTVTSDLAGKLLQINGGTIQPVSKLIEKTESYGTGSVVFCEPEERWDEDSRFKGPYKLNDIFIDLAEGLNLGNQNGGGIYVLSEDVALDDKGFQIGNATCVIELNGKTLDFNRPLSAGYNGDASLSISQLFAIHDETGNGTLKLNADMWFQQYICAVFSNLNLVLGRAAQFSTGDKGCQSLSMEHVTITEAVENADYLINAEGIQSLKLNDVVYENMSRVFCEGISKAVIANSRLTCEKTNYIFSILEEKIEAVSISYQGHVVLSADGGPFKWPSAEALQRILPSYEQCSADINEGIVIRMKNYPPGFVDKLQTAGYKLDPDPTVDSSAEYRYIMPDDSATIAILAELATPSDIIPVEDMPIATDSDADFMDDEIIDEDEAYEKSTPSNADESILDEDEPYQDDEEAKEDRNTSAVPMIPAVPSASPEDSAASEDKPEKEPEKKTEQEPEKEPEKETADLLHTEPSNVPDQREEEES